MSPSVFRLAFGLAAAAAIIAALLVASPSNADRHAKGGAGTKCGAFARATSFHGHATLSFSGTATGDVPGAGATETVTLDRHATNLSLNLTAKIVSKIPSHPGTMIFSGKGSGSSIAVGDTLSNSGVGVEGALQASGRPIFVTAALGLEPLICVYQLEVSYGIGTSFTGEPAFDPGSGVSGGAFTPERHIPVSLKLSGSAGVPAYYSGCATQASPSVLPPEGGCYQFGGGWATDFDTLKSCKSIVAVNCGPPDQQEGTATVSWSFAPTFPKKKKKKHP